MHTPLYLHYHRSDLCENLPLTNGGSPMVIGMSPWTLVAK